MNTAELPPGPSLALLQTARMVRDPFRWFSAWRARYGDPFTLPTLNGKVVCTGDPEGVHAIFAADPDTFAPFATKAILPVLGRGSVISMSGSAHKNERKRLAPAFQGARMQAYGPLMVAVARAHARAWRDGREFRMQDTAQKISLEIIVRAVFGVDEDALVDRFAASVARFADAMSPLVLFSSALQHEFLGVGPWARLQRARAEYDALILAQIHACRRRIERGDVGHDILSQILVARSEDGEGVDDEHTRDALVTLLFAGHVTTALALAWAFYWIHRDPKVLERLRAEIDPLRDADPEAIAALPYLDAVCMETLRLHPIVSDAPRGLARPLALRGTTVPAGLGVAALICCVHADPALYPEPNVFRPERFLERTFKPWEWLPFGGGARRCLGAAFALFEMKLVIATLLAENELELREREPVRPVRRSLIMGPATGVCMRLASKR